MKIAIYPGSFDPITIGHIDILKRALNIFDEIIILVADNPHKKSRFSVQERVEMIKETVKEYHNVKVDYSSGLSVKYAKDHHATHLIRGLRAVTDFEYEFQRALLLKKIDNDLETVFIMTNAKYSFVSSSGVRELATFGGQLKDLVPECIEERVRKHVYKKFE